MIRSLFDKMRPHFEEKGKLKAFCDLLFGDLFLIKGFRVVEGENGIFVGMPQQVSKQGKWFNVFMPATNELKEYINEVILQAYANQDESQDS